MGRYRAKTPEYIHESIALYQPLRPDTRHSDARSCPGGGTVLDFVPDRRRAVVGEVRDCTGSTPRRQAATCTRNQPDGNTPRAQTFPSAISVGMREMTSITAHRDPVPLALMPSGRRRSIGTRGTVSRPYNAGISRQRRAIPATTHYTRHANARSCPGGRRQAHAVETQENGDGNTPGTQTFLSAVTTADFVETAVSRH